MNREEVESPYVDVTDVTDEEALKKAETDKEKVFALLKEMYGYDSVPDSERVEAYHEYDEEGDTRQIRYVFSYGKETVDIMWDLSEEKPASVEIFED